MPRWHMVVNLDCRFQQERTTDMVITDVGLSQKLSQR